MNHLDAMTADATDLDGYLRAAFYALNDGGLNEAGRALYQARKLVAEGVEPTAEQADQLAWMDSCYLAGCGSY
jgi:hypothetical protein